MSELDGNGQPQLTPLPSLGQQVRLSRHFYPQASFAYGPASKLLRDVTVQAADGTEPMVLMFELPDSEQHVWLLSEEGRRALVKQLTGGLEVARSIPERDA